MKKYYILSIKIDPYDRYVLVPHLRIIKHWKNCGGKYNSHSQLFLGDDEILAEFYLTAVFHPSVRIKFTEQTITKINI